jgi:asparagine synthase (glutamine-hydrolysing)
MCGLTGIFDPSGRDASGLARPIAAMTARLEHRGPDDHGLWVDADTGIALGHRRLSIVDLSPEGHQPMMSVEGRHVIAFNGEIYNFKSLRAELAAQGHTFRGTSDTEVLLAVIERDGLDAALNRISGMFAFALWDRAERRLHLVRDRLGKKPLYYGWVQNKLVFASELKAITAVPGFQPQVDRAALTAYLRYQYVPAPCSIWKGIWKLPPGHRISLDMDAFGTAMDPMLHRRALPYWSMRSVAEQAVQRRFTGSPDAMIDRLDAVLNNAVAERMIADVPLGAFLSGGIDSSLIVAMMQSQSAKPVQTFTIGFNEGFYNEADDARRVARQLGTDHTEFVVTSDEARDIVPGLAETYDEPFADPSAVPTMHIARLARTKVTVCLSGDGGDEVFAGYGRYALASRLGDTIERYPQWLRGLAGQGVSGIPAGIWDATLGRLRGRAIPGLRGSVSGDRMHKLAALLDVRDRDALYHAMISLTRHPEALVLDGHEPLTPFTDPAWASTLADPLQRMMYRDTVTYLPDDILVKVDRASMATSLEVRSPLLDHRIIELAWRMPPEVMRHDGSGKWPLRQLLDRYLPAYSKDRQKQGFAIPLAEWLRGPLRDWAEDLLDEKEMESDGLLQPAPIRKLWREHLSASRNWSALLWTIVMFQSWRRQWLVPASECNRQRAEAA